MTTEERRNAEKTCGDNKECLFDFVVTGKSKYGQALLCVCVCACVRVRACVRACACVRVLRTRVRGVCISMGITLAITLLLC